MEGTGAEWCSWSVALDVVGGAGGGVGRAEVGAVAAEDLDPLRRASSMVVGDEMGGVAVPAAGHADVRGGGAGGLADDKWARSTVSPWAPWTVVA